MEGTDFDLADGSVGAVANDGVDVDLLTVEEDTFIQAYLHVDVTGWQRQSVARLRRRPPHRHQRKKQHVRLFNYVT